MMLAVVFLPLSEEEVTLPLLLLPVAPVVGRLRVGELVEHRWWVELLLESTLAVPAQVELVCSH